MFSFLIVVERLLSTTTTNGVFCQLCFDVWFCFGLQSGCAISHKQLAVAKEPFSFKRFLSFHGILWFALNESVNVFNCCINKPLQRFFAVKGAVRRNNHVI